MSRMTPLAWLYAVLALAGLVVPWYFNLQFAAAHGRLMTLGEFVSGAFVSPITSSWTSDFLIASVSTGVWMGGEARRLRITFWPFVVIALVVAFACACPLFLCVRELRLANASAREA